jgi:hypothetical protein
VLSDSAIAADVTEECGLQEVSTITNAAILLAPMQPSDALFGSAAGEGNAAASGLPSELTPELLALLAQPGSSPPPPLPMTDPSGGGTSFSVEAMAELMQQAQPLDLSSLGWGLAPVE